MILKRITTDENIKAADYLKCCLQAKGVKRSTSSASLIIEHPGQRIHHA